MSILRGPRAAVLLVILLGAVLPVAADSVQLVNGDVVSGRVLSLDDKQLRLQSDTLGQINIPRSKIASISLGEKKAAPAATSKAGAAATPEAVFNQLKAKGVTSQDMAELQKMFPQLANPDTAAYFNEMVKSVLGGTTSLGDLRKEALRAREQLKKSTRGLGPGVEAGVAPYFKILDAFIRETEPGAAQTKPKAVPPAQKK